MISKINKSLTIFVIVTAVACLAGCGTFDKNDWHTEFSKKLSVMGHRNWILIADSAYPAQTAPGIKIIVTRTDHFTVLNNVLTSIRDADHVRPKIYLDMELQYVSEQYAPGINNFRQKLSNVLSSQKTTYLPHDNLIAKLSESAEQFRVLVLKTDLTLPYTSVFIELDCGYWSEKAEKNLRQSIK